MSESISAGAACQPPKTGDYPRAKVPLSPPITLSGLGRSENTTHSLLDIRHICVSAGRAAIALALRHAGIGKGDQVLLPAYHCIAMITPLEHVGARAVYYRVHKNTDADIEDVRSKIGPRVRAVLATHYFGFPQRIADLRQLCDEHNLVLIEDCAHAFFGSADGRPLGSFGDYAIGSAMKFFPLFDGGLLASSTRDLNSIHLFRPPATLEWKSLINVIEYALSYGRLRRIGLPLKFAIIVKDALWGFLKKTLGKRLDKPLAPSSSEGGYGVDPEWVNASMSRISQFILMRSKRDRICEVRRRNYQAMIDALTDAPGIKPLFSNLPKDVVPWVVPVIVQDPVELFAKLKNAGVPISRFGEQLAPGVDEAVCTNAVFLSSSVFQFPCHSELEDEEIRWMVDTLKLHLSSSLPQNTR